MKKIIALTLVLILAVGLFAGCKSSDKGSVYFLNFKPEADSAWQALAKTYTDHADRRNGQEGRPHAVPVRQ